MLFILYGATGEMGYKSREYLKKNGFQAVDKYHYAVSPVLKTRYDARNFVSEEAFLDNTDSMFRYEVGGIMVGFSQQQISDAVCNKTNRLLPLSTRNLPVPFISALSEIKKIYGDSVCLVYTYIDDRTLQSVISRLDNVTEEEAKVRYEIGCDVKRNYLQYQHIFDHVLLYGGEDSLFNYQSLYTQIDHMLHTMSADKADDTHYGDVFVFYTQKDQDIYAQIHDELVCNGINVFWGSQNTVDHNWADSMARAIQNAKIVVPIITNNALSSSWVLEETNFAFECAEKNGTLIIPVFEEGVDLNQNADLERKMEFLNRIFISNNQVRAAATELADMIGNLLTAETTLKAFSRQVENYLCLKMYEQAEKCQVAYIALCDKVFAMSYGTFIDQEACLQARTKLISILLDMQQYGQALDCTIEALNFDIDSDMYGVLVEQFAICCAYLDMDTDAVEKLAKDRLIEFAGMAWWQGEDERVQKYFCSRLEKLLESFRKTLETAEYTRKKAEIPKTKHSADEDKIAEYGELAIALFEDIIQEQAKALSRHDLILGYERILNYCKHVGLKGMVADKCISRIAELSAREEPGDVTKRSMETDALKIYLGQAMPHSGEYDVFLSFKSEDEALARKVYDYLTQSGKEVFFSRETLLQRGDSEYERVIYDALDHAKHMVLVTSNPDYLKTEWVMEEWRAFNNELREGRKTGNLVLVMADDVVGDKGRLPGQLRQKEIIKTSEFRSRLLSYLR